MTGLLFLDILSFMFFKWSKTLGVLKQKYLPISSSLAYFIALPALILVGYLMAFHFPPDILGGLWQRFSTSLTSDFYLFIVAGFIAQMIDGALGMAYGISSTTFLLSMGISPAACSASVHTSEIFTSGVSGLMHLKFGNVNTKLFKRILFPGVLGAVIGACLLSYFEQYNHIIKPLVSAYTLVLGLIIVLKAFRGSRVKQKIKKIFPLAFTGGFLDAIGGGGWGPIVSSTLIASGRNARYAIGSVNLAEFFVALASSLTFITIIGLTHWMVIFGLVLGGVIAAPIASFLTNKIPAKIMMLVVGFIVIILSLKRIFL